MQYLLFSILSLFSFLFVKKQPDTKNISDPKAKVLLDEVSKKYKSFSSIDAKFTFQTENGQQNKTTTENGRVYLKGEKYRVEIGKQIVICDNKSVWTYMKDINELQINDYEPNKDEITPSNMFTIYQNDFDYLMNADEAIDKVNCAVVDLKPKKSDKPFFKVRIWIDKNAKYIKRMKIFDKNGNRYIYTVTSFNGKANLEDAIFKFDTSKYPGVKVEDLRM